MNIPFIGPLPAEIYARSLNSAGGIASEDVYQLMPDAREYQLVAAYANGLSFPIEGSNRLDVSDDGNGGLLIGGHYVVQDERYGYAGSGDWIFA